MSMKTTLWAGAAQKRSNAEQVSASGSKGDNKIRICSGENSASEKNHGQQCPLRMKKYISYLSIRTQNFGLDQMTYNSSGEICYLKYNEKKNYNNLSTIWSTDCAKFLQKHPYDYVPEFLYYVIIFIAWTFYKTIYQQSTCKLCSMNDNFRCRY